MGGGRRHRRDDGIGAGAAVAVVHLLFRSASSLNQAGCQQNVLLVVSSFAPTMGVEHFMGLREAWAFCWES